MEENREKYSEQRKQYKLKNREKIYERQRKWNEKNPEKRLRYAKKTISKLSIPLKYPSNKLLYALGAWSKTIKKLGNGICAICNSKAEISHHLIYKSTEPKLSLNIGNGIALCRKHHNECHGWTLGLNYFKRR